LNLPYKHLGNSKEGIDCFNLCVLIYKEILGVKIPYNTTDSGCDVDLNWYSRPETSNILLERANAKWGWDIVQTPQPFDVILMSIGSTNAPNHCGLFLGRKLLQITEGRNSWVSSYNRYYEQYTVKIGRWKNDFKI
jgi:cell wall-associated NlpC family hydrolase